MANMTEQHNLIVLPSPASSGLPRLASEAEAAGEGHQIEFRALRVRSLLNRTVSHRGFSAAWSINPYRGCEFACRYCYARYTHEFLTPDSAEQEGIPPAELFERRIFLKQNAPWLLHQELRRVRPEEEIAIGTATDPYQPIERKARITRSILEVLAQRSGHRIGIVTKSALILRDRDLLQQIAARNRLVIHLTITTPDATLARLLEPRAPRPDLRLRAVRLLRDAGLTAGILGSPVLPGLTDSRAAIVSMAEHAAAAGASFFAAEPLFLKPCSRPTYLSFVREHFPHLLAATERRFADRAFATPAYRDEIARHVAFACQSAGVPRRSTDALLTRDAGLGRKPPATAIVPAQASLFA